MIKHANYCESLRTNIKTFEKDHEVRNDYVNQVYLCSMTGNECVAKKISKDLNPVYCYKVPVIDEDILKNCPARNIPVNLAIKVRKVFLDKVKSKLEERILNMSKF